MSDTTTITPEERARLRAIAAKPNHLSHRDGIHAALNNLLDALEQAEARADELETYIAKLVCELTDGRLSEPYDISVITDEVEAIYRAHTEEAVVKATAKAEADNARLTKMAQILSEWCAQFESGHTLEEIGLALSNGMACPEPWQYSEEAARRAVADESEGEG